MLPRFLKNASHYTGKNFFNMKNQTHKQCQADPTIKTVAVCFDQENGKGKSYTYKTRLKLKKGDLCNVKTPRGVIVVRVVTVHKEAQVSEVADFELKWIASKVDMQAIRAGEKEDRDFAKAKLSLKESLGDLF